MFDEHFFNGLLELTCRQGKRSSKKINPGLVPGHARASKLACAAAFTALVSRWAEGGS